MSMQTATEPARSIAPPIAIRRFEVPDIHYHGGWLIKRFVAAYPHISERQLPGWLQATVYNNEFLFLFQENSCALAQMLRPDPFTPKTVIYERFVWARDPKNQDHVAEAARFYERFKVWAAQHEASHIVVGEVTDVPREMIGAIMGKLLERRELFARL